MRCQGQDIVAAFETGAVPVRRVQRDVDAHAGESTTTHRRVPPRNRSYLRTVVAARVRIHFGQSAAAEWLMQHSRHFALETHAAEIAVAIREFLTP